MALETCKECGNQISSKAQICPHCGAPIRRTSLAVKAIIGFFALGIIGSIWGNYIADKHQQEANDARAAQLAAMTPTQRDALAQQEAAQKSLADEREREKNAAYICEKGIKNSLKDPSSAEFLWTPSEAPSKKNKKGIYETQEKVRAANSFGALDISYFNCRIELSNDTWHILSIKEFN